MLRVRPWKWTPVQRDPRVAEFSDKDSLSRQNAGQVSPEMRFESYELRPRRKTLKNTRYEKVR